MCTLFTSENTTQSSMLAYILLSFCSSIQTLQRQSMFNLNVTNFEHFVLYKPFLIHRRSQFILNLFAALRLLYLWWSSWHFLCPQRYMLIDKVLQCTIIEILQLNIILWCIQCSRRDTKRKVYLLIDLSFLYEIMLGETDCFCNDISVLMRERSNSIEYTDAHLIKITSSRVMTRSKIRPCLSMRVFLYTMLDIF